MKGLSSHRGTNLFCARTKSSFRIQRCFQNTEKVRKECHDFDTRRHFAKSLSGK
eukprot:15133.XXX_1082588_1082749_1 [CDS] Oithona nana genome sequencing.